MNEKIKALTTKLSKHLGSCTCDFLIEEIGGTDQNTAELLNAVLSAHLTSAFTLMDTLSEDNKKMNKKVIQFIKNLTNYMASLEVITEVQLNITTEKEV